MASKRRLLMEAIRDYLAGEVTTANGYAWNLTVYAGKKNFGDEISAKLPVCNVLEDFNPDRVGEEIGGNVGTKIKYQQRYLLSAWVSNEDDDLANHDVLAAIKKALGKLRTRETENNGYFGGLCIGLFIEPGVARPPDELSSRTYCWLRIRTEVVEKVGDPDWISG